MTRHRAARAADVPPDSVLRIDAGGVPVCLVHAEDGGFYAIGDVCTHEEYLLSNGELWGMQVECPQHGSRFDVRTGAVTGLPAVVPAQTFPVTVEDGEVYVDV